MAIVYLGNAGGGSGGGVQDVTAADTSVVVGGTAAHPTVRTGTLDVIAADHPAAADWSNNSHKITSLANGSAASDALAYGQVFATGALPIADIADPGSGKVIGSSGGQAAAVNPPGFEIGYDPVATGNINVTGTTEGSPTTLITCAAHTFDGAPVLAVFFTPGIRTPTSAVGFVVVGIYESGTIVDRLGSAVSTSVNTQQLWPVMMGMRFTPSAGSHSYTIAAFCSATTGTPLVASGAGGAGNNPPMWVRFTKV